MLTLHPVNFSSITPIFAGIQHNAALVYGVLEGSSRGKILADAAAGPSYALIAVDGAFMYLGGVPGDERAANQLVDYIFDVLVPQTPDQELVLFAFENEAQALLQPFVEARGGFVIYRKLFEFDRDRFAAQSGWRDRLGQGMVLRPIDAALAERFPQFSPLVDPVSRRFGYALLVDGLLASACTAVSVGGGEAEIDIFTEAPYRGRGLATLTACAFIEGCLERGLRPAWSCWPYRSGSYALARKLGFVEQPDVPAFYWAPQ